MKLIVKREGFFSAKNAKILAIASCWGPYVNTIAVRLGVESVERTAQFSSVQRVRGVDGNLSLSRTTL